MYKYIFLIFLFIYFFENFHTAPYYCKTNLFSQWQCIVFVIVFSIQELNAQCSMGLFGNFTDPRVKDCAIFVKPL